MNVAGDNAQIGEVQATAAGRDIRNIHNDLVEVAGILKQFTDALEAQREEDREERRDRQREIDMQTAGVQSAINALRSEQATTRHSIATVQATITALDDRTRYVPLMTIAVTALSALTILIIGAVGVILYIILTRPELVALFR